MSKKFNYFDDESTVHDDKFDVKELLQDALTFIKRFERKSVKVAKTAYNEIEQKDATTGRNLLATLIMLAAFLLIIVIIVVSFVVNVGHEQRKEERFNSAADKVCSRYEAEYGVCNYESLGAYNISGYRMTGLCYAREIDFDDDSKSELFLCYNDNGDYYTEVWGFSGKDFKRFYKSRATQTKDVKDDVWVTLYTHNNKTYICTHDKKDISKVQIYAMHGDEFKKKKKATYDAVSEQFLFGKKDATTSFERVKLSIIRELSASINTERVLGTIDSFTKQSRDVIVQSKDDASTQAENMKAAYYSIITEYNDKYGVAEMETGDGNAYMQGLGVVELIDFNNDGDDELVLVYRRQENQRTESSRGEYIAITVDKYFMDVYYWNGKKAVLAYQKDGIGTMLNDDSQQYYIIRNKGNKKQLGLNTFKVENYGRKINATSKLLKFTGTAFEPVFKSQYITEYGYTQYYIDGERTYKSGFTSKNGYMLPFFDGTQTYDSKEYRVVYLQTDMVHSSRLKNRTQDTIDTIKSLDSSYEP